MIQTNEMCTLITRDVKIEYASPIKEIKVFFHNHSTDPFLHYSEMGHSNVSP